MNLRYLLPLLLLSFSSGAQSLYFPPVSGSSWDTLSPARLGYCPSRIDSLYAYLDSNHSKAFILLKDGKIVLEKYFNGHDAVTAWQWASAGKTITAFLTGIAQQEGTLSITDTTSKYLGVGWTSLPRAKEDAITVRHQLTMTTGLDESIPNSDCTLDTCLLYKADAGTRWAYHNAPYTLLSKVLQSATGLGLNAYTTLKLKTPTGMTGAFVPLGDNEVYFSTARSFARFGVLMLGKGTWNGTRIMSDTAYFRAMTSTSQSLNPSYGYLWWLNGKSGYMIPQSQLVIPGPLNPHAPSDAIAAMGKDGQFLNVVPSQNIVWLRMGEAPDGFPVPFLMNDRIWEYVNALKCAPAVVSKVAVAQKISISPNPAQGLLHIATSQSGHFRILDMQGRTLISGLLVPEAQPVDISALHPGAFLIQMELSDGSLHRQALSVK